MRACSNRRIGSGSSRAKEPLGACMTLTPGPLLDGHYATAALELGRAEWPLGKGAFTMLCQLALWPPFRYRSRQSRSPGFVSGRKETRGAGARSSVAPLTVSGPASNCCCLGVTGAGLGTWSWFACCAPLIFNRAHAGRPADISVGQPRFCKRISVQWRNPPSRLPPRVKTSKHC